METTIDLLDDPAIREADSQAVQAFLTSGTPVSQEVYDRVEARALRATEAIRQRLGEVNIIHELIREIRG